MDLRHPGPLLKQDRPFVLPGRSGRDALHGVVTALVTPLRADRTLDREAMERLIEGQITAGVHGLFVLGSVGEGPLLSDTQFRLAAQVSAAATAGRRLLLGGASDNSVERCLSRLTVLADAGIQAGVVTLPHYGWPPRIEESIAFFRAVAAQSPLPIVAYDLPKVVGWQMPAAVLEALFAIPNVIGIKSTHADFDAMAAICESPKRPVGFSFLPGNTRLAARLFSRGADGVVCTPSNICPEPFVALYEAARAGRTEVVEQLDRTLVPMLVKLLDLLPTGAASIKAALEAGGRALRHTVPPWPEAADADITRARRALAELADELRRYSLTRGCNQKQLESSP